MERAGCVNDDHNLPAEYSETAGEGSLADDETMRGAAENRTQNSTESMLKTQAY